MLISLNDILSNGYIPGLWPRDELDGVVNLLKNEARSKGIKDSPDELYKYFIDKIKQNIHLVLCMSPVGETLRIRSRKFPGLINSTIINWFHAWPKDALYDVAKNYLSNIEFPIENAVEKIAENMAETHSSIDITNKEFLMQERRDNYTTPKSYLELIEFYKSKLSSKRKDINTQIENLNRGLDTLSRTESKVKGIEEELKKVMVQ